MRSFGPDSWTVRANIWTTKIGARRPGLSLINRRKEQACLPRLLLRALSRLIEQHRRALCRGHLGARSRTSGLAPPTAVGSSPFLTIALRPASGRLDIFITGRMRFLN